MSSPPAIAAAVILCIRLTPMEISAGGRGCGFRATSSAGSHGPPPAGAVPEG